VFNGRAVVQNKTAAAKNWAAEHTLVMAASSDAHGPQGWGRTGTLVKALPTANNLKTILQDAKLIEQTVGVRGALYPKFNRLRKRATG
jgi:hypothetical protein